MLSHHHKVESYTEIFKKLEVIKHLNTTHNKKLFIKRIYLKISSVQKKKQRNKKNAKGTLKSYSKT